MTIQAFNREIDAVRLSWVALVDLLIQGGIDSTKQRGLFEQQTLEIVRKRADLVFETLLSIRSDDPEAISSIVIASRQAELTKQTRVVQQQADALLGQLRAQWRESTKVKEVNDSFSLQLFDGDSHYANLDITSGMQVIHGAFNSIIGKTSSLLPLCKADSVLDLSLRAEAVGNTLRDIEGLKKQSQQQAKAAESSATRAAAKEKAAQDIATQAEVAIAKLGELQKQANTDASSVGTLIEQIKTIGAAASKLEALVVAYQSKFEAFQSELDNRNRELAEFKTETTAAKSSNLKREAEIDRLSGEANSMISGATTAGLAKSLEDARARYETRMIGARRGFVVAVILLVLSAVPLAAHLIPGLFGDFFRSGDGSAGGGQPAESWYAVLGKFLLLVPATWLTAFFTKTFADYFHLEREYAHKAALAMSVDGFKRQAPKYEEEITAEVFLEIKTNPARGHTVEPAAHPLYDILAKTVAKLGKNDKKTDRA